MRPLDLPRIHEHPVMPALNVPVGSYYIRGLLSGALARGFDAENIFEQARVPIDALNPEAVVNGEQLQRLILCVREVLNDDYLGFLQVPAKLAMDIEAGRAAMRGSHLGEGLRNLAGFINAVRSDEERTLLVDDLSEEVSLGFRFSGFVTGADPHVLYSYRMYWSYRFYCWLIGQRIKLTGVDFSGPRPANGIDYQQVLACPVRFGQPTDRLSFHKKWLTEPTVRREAELSGCDFPLNYPNWFTIPGRDQTLSCRVAQILIRLHREGQPAPLLDAVANMLTMSSRSLSRKLASEGESFQKIKSSVRYELAKDMLLHSDMLVAAISSRLGFSEPGDFTRAFIGWTGKTPSTYRRLHRSKGLRLHVLRLSDLCARKTLWKFSSGTCNLGDISDQPDPRASSSESLRQ